MAIAATSSSQPAVRSHGGNNRRTGTSPVPRRPINASCDGNSDMSSGFSMETLAQRLQRAGVAPGRFGGLAQRAFAQAELLDRLALSRRQGPDGIVQEPRALFAFGGGA